MLSHDSSLSVTDFEWATRRKLLHAVYDFIPGGTEDGVSLAANRECFDRVAFRPRGLTGVADRSQAVKLWGAS